MGLVTNYPAVRIDDPASSVAVWDGAHRFLGALGPADTRSTAVNITCTLDRWNGRWYKLWNSSAWGASSAYVSAARTHLIGENPPGYVLGPSVDNTDQPGRSLSDRVLLVSAALMLVLALRRTVQVRRGRGPNPPDPAQNEVPGPA